MVLKTEGEKPDFPDHAAAQAYQSLQSPVWIFDIDRHAIWWANRSAIGFWNAESLEALLSRDFSGDSDMVRQRLKQIVEHTAPGCFASETWTLYPLGRPTTVLLYLTPVTIEGEHDAVVIQVTAGIELGGDPDALRQLEATRYTPLMVSTIGLDGHVLSTNPAAIEAYGRFDEQEEGGRPTALAKRFVDSFDLERLLSAARADQDFEGDIEVVTRNGGRWHHVDARRGRDPVTGKPVIVITEEDVSDRVQLADERLQLNRALEERVSLRTAELERQSQRLRQEMALADELRSRAESATKAKSAFLANMSHELRTPLNAILGFSEVIQRQLHGQLDPRYLGYVNDIHTSGENLLSLINDLLDLSRIEAGRLDLQEEVFDPTGVIAAAVDMIEAGKRGMSLSIEQVLPALPPIYADPRAFRQILLNLLSNAVKASEPGGQIVVSADAGAFGLTVSIADEGCGISEQDMAIVMSPYGQANPATRGWSLAAPSPRGRGSQGGGSDGKGAESGRGTGLGLAISKGLAEALGGRLLLESRLGEGTTASLELPPERLRSPAVLAASR